MDQEASPNQASTDPDTSTSDGDGYDNDWWNYCPNCGHELTNMSCKYRCPNCRYFMSCSDFDR